MYAGKVELCGVDTARLPVLSEAEKSRLIKAARAGDRQARQEMVQGNLRLVLSVVQRFAGRGENMDDLFQVGCIGLIKAIDNFDPAQNVRFSTYGVPMIVGEVKRYLREQRRAGQPLHPRPGLPFDAGAGGAAKAERARAEALRNRRPCRPEPGERRYGAGIRCDADEPV